MAASAALVVTPQPLPKRLHLTFMNSTSPVPQESVAVQPSLLSPLHGVVMWAHTPWLEQAKAAPAVLRGRWPPPNPTP